MTAHTQMAPIHARLTWQYVTGWSGLDNWVRLADGRMTKPQQVDHSADYDSYSERCVLTFKASAWNEIKRQYRRLRPEWEHVVTRPHRQNGKLVYCRDLVAYRPSLVRFVARAIADCLSHSCRCEHDCCGHWNVGCSATYIGKRRFRVELHHAANV